MKPRALKTKNSGVPLSQVRPFFQVVVFLRRGAAQPKLRTEIQNALTEHRRRDCSFEIVRSESKGSALQYAHVKHTRRPSWVRSATRIEDLEHDEVLLYQNRRFLFLHSNCRSLLDVLVAWLEKTLTLVPGGDIEKVLMRRKAEIRSLGMQNLNAPGWGAPEGKIYFARDAAHTLSPTGDSMFGFRHAFAVERGPGQAKARPFGCSTTKRKVWGTWVEDSDSFVVECERVSADLIARAGGSRSWVLAEPIAKPPAGIRPIAFYADYSLPRQGMVWLETGPGGTFSPDWICYLGPNDTARFEITANDGAVFTTDLELDTANSGVRVRYHGAAAPLSAKVCDDSGELEHRRSRDLVDLLNKGEGFTVVFTHSLAYRSGQFWKNTGLAGQFAGARTDISWKGVDIRRESLSEGRTDTIGDAVLDYLRGQGWPRAVFCDDGSNEIADYLVVGERRYVLIHAKFSKQAQTGLRVQDVQEVLAQCLKNLRFYQWPALEAHVERLETRVVPGLAPAGDVRDLLRSICEDQRTRRECWVVQPGVSERGLANSKGNKIHALLNHALSACLPNNVEFHFFCSP